MRGIVLITFMFSLQSVHSQIIRPSLEQISLKMNKTLPEIYDPITKLQSTTVEHNNFFYHFVVDASKKEFGPAFPKVQAQILKTVCSRPAEKSILVDNNANIVYRYESLKGESLGQFMIRPEHCKKKVL